MTETKKPEPSGVNPPKDAKVVMPGEPHDLGDDDTDSSRKPGEPYRVAPKPGEPQGPGYIPAAEPRIDEPSTQVSSYTSFMAHNALDEFLIQENLSKPPDWDKMTVREKKNRLEEAGFPAPQIPDIPMEEQSKDAQDQKEADEYTRNKDLKEARGEAKKEDG